MEACDQHTLHTEQRAEGIEPSLPPRQGGVRPQHFARRRTPESAQRESNPRFLLGREACGHNTLHTDCPHRPRAGAATLRRPRPDGDGPRPTGPGAPADGETPPTARTGRPGALRVQRRRAGARTSSRRPRGAETSDAHRRNGEGAGACICAEHVVETDMHGYLDEQRVTTIPGPLAAVKRRTAETRDRRISTIAPAEPAGRAQPRATERLRGSRRARRPRATTRRRHATTRAAALPPRTPAHLSLRRHRAPGRIVRRSGIVPSP
jgi:hypothetical protein